MKFKKIIVVLFVIIFNQFTFSQIKIVSKKLINKELRDAGLAFVNFEVEKSLKLSKSALEKSHQIKDDELMAKSYNIIGLNFEEFYDVKKAIDFYNKALYHANLTQNDSLKDWIYNNLGNAYTYRNIDFKKGIAYYKKGLLFAEKINDPIEVMYTELNISAAYFAIKDFKSGLNYLNAAKDNILASDQLEAKIMMCSQYGSYYSNSKDNQKAELFFNEAIKLGEQNKSGIIDATIADVYLDFSEHYKSTKQFEKALSYLNLYKELKEKIYNTERTNKVKISGSQIETDEYKRQIDKIEGEKSEQLKDLKESKLIVILFAIIFLILILFLTSLYRNNELRAISNKELTLANANLKEAKEKAEEASLLKSQFVATISHELRTPLYGVVGITNIILDEHKELENSPHLNSLKFSAKYLLSLVNDLLQINKIEENKITIEKTIFNLEDELRTISDSLEFIAIKNKNKIKVKIDQEIPEILIGDKLRLAQIFMNLVSNALKFTNDGIVEINATWVKYENLKHYVKFEISDNGIGIAEEDQIKIFEKFVQIERKESDYQGTGLGLSIVKKLVELFESTISIESKEGVGTKFYFTIGFEADENSKNGIINNIEVDLSSYQYYKILVVEDNKINQLITRKILENNNFKTTILDDGYAAINLLESEQFDVVLMDINMPVINGFETTKLIRKKGLKIPIIALTAFDKQEIIEDALACGMNEIIVKPFDSAKLFQIISNLVNKKNAD